MLLAGLLLPVAGYLAGLAADATVTTDFTPVTTTNVATATTSTITDATTATADIATATSVTADTTPTDATPATTTAIATPTDATPTTRDLVCLAMNIYHEGRGESVKGQAAIAAVTMNRVRSGRYPDRVCEVVWQRKQFSWTLLPPRYYTIRDGRAWQRAMVVAELFLKGARMALVGDAMHYHTVDVQPDWSKNSRLVALIGGHLFYTL